MDAHVYAGFLGGLASSATLQPLDLLKTRLQQQPTVGLGATLKTLTSIREAWRGTLPSVIRTSVGAGLYLGTLSKLREARALANKNGTQIIRHSSALPRLSAIGNVLTGAAARASVGFVMIPVTVVKVRFESSLFNYTSMYQATKDIVNGPNGWRGLFAGYGATVSRDAPYAGLYMFCYETSKDLLQWMPGPLANSAAAVNAAVLASTATAPFDTIKTRIQVSVTRLSFIQAWREVTQNGYTALFDGLSLRLARKALSASISWGIYEEIVKKTTASSRGRAE